MRGLTEPRLKSLHPSIPVGETRGIEIGFIEAKGDCVPEASFRSENRFAVTEQLRAHTMLVIGGRDMEAGAVSVRLHHGGPQGAKPKGEVIADILASIKERRA